MTKMKSICLLFLLMILAIAGTHNGVEATGECGEFSPDRILTHTLRHCKKAVRDVAAPVSAQCCNSLLDVPIPCYYTIINSDLFKNYGIDPQIAFTIPKRCHFIH